MKLIDVCKFIVDCPHSTANDEGSGYPLIRTPNVGRGRLILSDVHRVCEEVYNKRNARAIPMAGDLIMAREAPAGNVAVIQPGEKVCLGQRTVLIRPDIEKVNPNFLAYYLLGPKQQHALTSTANGATVAHVNMPHIRNLDICLPSRKEQDTIANYLSAYDAKIESVTKEVKLIEENAQLLYKEWFINLRCPYISEKFQDNGLPNGWSIATLGDIAYDAGVAAKKQNRNDFCYYLPIDCMPKKSLCYTVVDDVSLAESSLQSFQPGDIVMGAMRPYFHKVIIARDKGLTRNTCFVINAKNKSFWAYLALLIFSEETIKYASQISVGATMPYVRWGDFVKMPIIIPSKEIADKFSEIITPMIERINTLAVITQRLIEARNILLPKLISGEVSI